MSTRVEDVEFCRVCGTVLRRVRKGQITTADLKSHCGQLADSRVEITKTTDIGSYPIYPNNQEDFVQAMDKLAAANPPPKRSRRKPGERVKLRERGKEYTGTILEVKSTPIGDYDLCKVEIEVQNPLQPTQILKATKIVQSHKLKSAKPRRRRQNYDAYEDNYDGR